MYNQCPEMLYESEILVNVNFMENLRFHDKFIISLKNYSIYLAFCRFYMYPQSRKTLFQNLNNKY